MDDSSGCYDWYVAVNGSARLELALNVTSQMFIWVHDPSRASSEEAALNATMPSTASRELSRQLFLLGGFPNVIVSQGGAVVTVQSSPSFNSASGYWSFDLYATAAGAGGLIVYGNNVSLLECDIRDRTLEWYAVFAVPSALVSGPASVNGDFTLQHQGCNTALSVLLPAGGSRALILSRSRNSFALPFVFAANITGAWFSQTALLVLMNGQVFNLQQTASSPALSSGLPIGAITDLRPYAGCDLTLTPTGAVSDTNNLVLAFSTQNVSAVYFSRDGGLSFSLFTGLNATSVAVNAVLDAAILQTGPTFVFLVRNDVGNQQVLIFNDATSRWTVGAELSGSLRLDQRNAVPQVIIAPSGSGEMFLWGSQLLYSIDAGATVQSLRLNNRIGGTALQPTEIIRTVAVGKSGMLALLTSQMRLFVGIVGLPDLYEFQSGLSPLSFAQLQFDIYDHLEIVTSSPTGTLSVRVVAVANELSIVAPSCPYSATHQQPAVLHMDYGDTVSFNYTISAAQFQDTGLSVRISDVSLLSASVNSSLWYTEATLAVRSLTVSLSEAKGMTSTFASVSTIPTAAQATCSFPQQVTEVRIGCPPNRQIRLDRTATTSSPNCEALKTGATYGIPAAARADGTALSGLVYDHATFGCPMQIRHDTDGFRPAFNVYDSGVLTKALTGNFVIRELNNRTDFTFNATAAAAGCLRAPQTWSAVLRNNSNPDMAWTISTYSSCFVAPAIPYTDVEYEILNSTGVNALVWQGNDRDGLYLFRAYVVDPQFSYCTLTAYFALDVIGAPVEGNIIGAILGGAVGGLLLLLGVAGLYYYMKKPKLE
eukprot:TRINITY_DN7164_c0_g1_i2.p1 TRINITY_DN7164_c0_g1~~TRINITY_DN7164_c0_g1_i2.p1  ORF type:complete len:942 (+),score=182.39 TRINITY_DN7164_c0_g1_i2:360-2828(+)